MVSRRTVARSERVGLARWGTFITQAAYVRRLPPVTTDDVVADRAAQYSVSGSLLAISSSAPGCAGNANRFAVAYRPTRLSAMMQSNFTQQQQWVYRVAARDVLLRERLRRWAANSGRPSGASTHVGTRRTGSNRHRTCGWCIQAAAPGSGGTVDRLYAACRLDLISARGPGTFTEPKI